MKESKEYYRVGYRVYLLSKIEVQLLVDLSNCNLLKFTPEKLEVYGAEGETE